MFSCVDLSVTATLPWIVFGGVGPIGLGYYLWAIGVKRGSARLIALLAYSIPVGGSILWSVFFGETQSAGLLSGALMVTAGAYLERRATRSS